MDFSKDVTQKKQGVKSVIVAIASSSRRRTTCVFTPIRFHDICSIYKEY